MDLNGKRVAVLAENQYQEMELWYPIYRLREAGAEVRVVAPRRARPTAASTGIR
jgi:protease I